MQHSSRQTTGAQYSFGTSSRAHDAKTYVSPEHAQHVANPTTANANSYQTASMMGKQQSSKKPSAPSFGFGQSPRFADQQRVLRGTKTPGPVYRVETAFGARKSTQGAHEPAFSFGNGGRAAEFESAAPGPGAYEAATSHAMGR